MKKLLKGGVIMGSRVMLGSRQQLHSSRAIENIVDKFFDCKAKGTTRKFL
ncbi:hypothetical protein [Lederbergia citrea]|uniref:Uncharacterized protein n=1 Tax=Lederbergia citrea TaxID=2833581 RepID=A0A942Z727_9BACI|nr:hypothetical protein [Lederbergia citrea]MBS4224686.1 hypothetical protein [Lederbergia citrea]